MMLILFSQLNTRWCNTMGSFSKLFKCSNARPIKGVVYWKRFFMTSPRSTVTELKIPTGEGSYVTAKDWGPPNGHPILALHGWQDNAGSFDNLVPLLDPSYRVVALDFPGHGWSSHRSQSTDYYPYMETIMTIKKVTRFLKWNKTTLLGHSMGGGMAVIYASIFPEEVNATITLDIFKPVSFPSDDMAERTESTILDIISNSDKFRRPAPVYSVDDARRRLMVGQRGSLTEGSADVLLKRGSRAQDGGVVFTRDIRLQNFFQELPDEYVERFLGRFRCDLLVVLAKGGFHIEPQDVVEKYQNLYARNCNVFKMVEVKGSHHTHLNSPELVAPHVNAFLNRK